MKVNFLKKILVLHTGGTISMTIAPDGVHPDVENPLLGADQVIVLPKNVELVVEDFSNVPSPHVQLEDMLEIKHRIQRAVKEENIDGVVITHGTDTLEETAFFLDMTIGNLVPIVMTGAMRSINELGSDGLYNFQSAIRVAVCKGIKNKGVVVVMNDEIHSARYVTKTHTTNVATFRTPTLGPLGLVTKTDVMFMQELVDIHRYDIEGVAGIVPILKAYAGMGSKIFELVMNDEVTGGQINGLVVEALGAGNMPPKTLPGLRKAIENEIPVILVSRCFNGVAEPVYSYEGGGVHLEKMGVIFCRGINSQKARIKLLIALNAGLKGEELKHFIQDY